MSFIQDLGQHVARHLFYDLALRECLNDLDPFEGYDENGRFFLFNEQTAFEMVIDNICERFCIQKGDDAEFSRALFDAIPEQTWDALKAEAFYHIKDQAAHRRASA